MQSEAGLQVGPETLCLRDHEQLCTPPKLPRLVLQLCGWCGGGVHVLLQGAQQCACASYGNLLRPACLTRRAHHQ